MKNSSLIAALAITASSYHMPDVHLNPEPWAIGNRYRGGSGTGKTGLDVARSRKAAKAARKARRKHRLAGA